MPLVEKQIWFTENGWPVSNMPAIRDAAKRHGLKVSTRHFQIPQQNEWFFEMKIRAKRKCMIHLFWEYIFIHYMHGCNIIKDWPPFEVKGTNKL